MNQIKNSSPDLAPDFELRDTNDAPHRLSDYRGKIVVLAFLRGFM